MAKNSRKGMMKVVNDNDKEIKKKDLYELPKTKGKYDILFCHVTVNGYYEKDMVICPYRNNLKSDIKNKFPKIGVVRSIDIKVLKKTGECIP